MGKKLVPIVTFVLAFIGLGIFSFLGVYARMFTDDYCYSHSYDSLGLIGTLKGYYFITTFTAHRYALTFFEWVIDRFGIAGIQITPLVVLFLWGWAVFLLLQKANSTWKLGRTRMEVAAISGVLMFFSVFLLPNLYQSLYWRTGILPYTAPLVAGLWLLVYLLDKKSSRPVIRYGILGLGAFVSSGFSEAGAVFIAALFGLVIVWCLYHLLRGNRKTWGWFGIPSLLVIGVILLALLMMYLSPVNIDRQAGYQAPASVGMTFVYAFRFSVAFIWLSFRTQPLPNLVFCLFVAAFSFYLNKDRKVESRFVFRASLLAIILAAALIFIIHLPSAYVEKSPPADRTLVMARFTLLAAELTVFYFIGHLAENFSKAIKLKPVWWCLAALGIILMGWIYIGRAGILILLQEQPRYVRVADVWDQRDEQIRAAVAAGEKEITVLPIDSQYVGGLLELYPQPNWVNLCAAEYYGIKTIRAAESW